MSENLKQYLLKAKEAYYSGNPIISDSQYDSLEEIYEKTSGKLISIGTNRGRTPHWFKMYSLNKYYEGDILPFDGNHNIVCVTPKLDGAALAIRYIDGELDSIVTRGDGEYGEDVTFLFKENPTITAENGFCTWYKGYIPKNIKEPGIVQVTGELCAPKTISNARNYASGALGLKDSKEFFNRDLRFFAYDWQPYMYPEYETHLYALHDFRGFNIAGDDLSYEYPSDGWVHRLNSIEKYKELGYTSKHPKGAFALKERTEGVKTKILDVVWQTGKTGKVTPIAILDPVDIDGAQISRATLNNPGFIEALGVCIGDYVMVERAGGIIPRIIRKAE